MSFQLQINNQRETEAIDISLGRQFFAPIVFLVFIILGASILLEDVGVSSGSAYTVDASANPAAINQLHRQLADLEGESQRLKAFAKKMVKLAKLDKGIFEFDKPPARGGLGGRNIFQRFTANMTIAMARDVDVLKKQLIEQSNQFERMQLVIRSKLLGESEKLSSWPVTAAYISSEYGLRKDPFTGRQRKHNGIDLAGPRGSDILSVAAGKVTFTGRKGGYGRFIEIKHADGVVSRYAHLEASLVKKGQTVAVGEKIARLGTSGRSTGPHLHLEILKNNKNIDPMIFLQKKTNKSLLNATIRFSHSVKREFISRNIL